MAVPRKFVNHSFSGRRRRGRAAAASLGGGGLGRPRSSRIAGGRRLAGVRGAGRVTGGKAAAVGPNARFEGIDRRRSRPAGEPGAGSAPPARCDTAAGRAFHDPGSGACARIAMVLGLRSDGAHPGAVVSQGVSEPGAARRKQSTASTGGTDLWPAGRRHGMPSAAQRGAVSRRRDRPRTRHPPGSSAISLGLASPERMTRCAPSRRP